MSKTGFKKGRLGIGTDNPRYPLDVVGDIRLTGGFRDASGNDFNFLAINNVDYIKQEDINGITSSNSKIGIGTTSPETLLTVGNHAFTNGTRDLLRFPSYRHNEAFTIRNNDDDVTGRLEFFGEILKMVVENTII